MVQRFLFTFLFKSFWKDHFLTRKITFERLIYLFHSIIQYLENKVFRIYTIEVVRVDIRKFEKNLLFFQASRRPI